MNCYQIILEYINNIELGEPIFINDIKKYVFTYNAQNGNMKKADLVKLANNIKVILNRMKKNEIICQAEKGIYYKPIKTIWGRHSVSPIYKIRDYKYLKDKDGNIKGYISGAKLFNMIGLTTQVPNIIDIVTNKCPNNNKYYIEKYNIIIHKPKILINNDNYKYLQLLDVLSNNDKINIEVDNPNDVLYQYMQNSNLTFEKLLKYARETNNQKVLTKIWALAR